MDSAPDIETPCRIASPRVAADRPRTVGLPDGGDQVKNARCRIVAASGPHIWWRIPGVQRFGRNSFHGGRKNFGRFSGLRGRMATAFDPRRHPRRTLRHGRGGRPHSPGGPMHGAGLSSPRARGSVQLPGHPAGRPRGGRAFTGAVALRDLWRSREAATPGGTGFPGCRGYPVPGRHPGAGAPVQAPHGRPWPARTRRSARTWRRTGA